MTILYLYVRELNEQRIRSGHDMERWFPFVGLVKETSAGAGKLRRKKAADQVVAAAIRPMV
jgi:hypothetical protein